MLECLTSNSEKKLQPFLLTFTLIVLLITGCADREETQKNQNQKSVSQETQEEIKAAKELFEETNLASNELPEDMRQKIAEQERADVHVFEENKGQFGPGTDSILFVFMGQEGQYYLRKDGWSNVLRRFVPDDETLDESESVSSSRKKRRPPQGTISTHRVDFTWQDFSRSAKVFSLKPSQEVRNYLNRPQGDIHNVRIFAKVGFENLYPGVNLEVVRSADSFEQSYTLTESKYLSAIKIAVDYSDGVVIGEAGDSLTVKTSLGDFGFAVYAEQDGKKLDVKFTILDSSDNKRPIIGFISPIEMDESRPLVLKLVDT